MSSNADTALGACGDWWGDKETDDSDCNPEPGATPDERGRDWAAVFEAAATAPPEIPSA